MPNIAIPDHECWEELEQDQLIDIVCEIYTGDYTWECQDCGPVCSECGSATSWCLCGDVCLCNDAEHEGFCEKCAPSAVAEVGA
jgi:hypothetical protein